jgi:chorismate dehydratase
LIGNPALAFLRNGSNHAIWDLGSAWQELTGLPFTYALWAIRDGVEAGPLVATLSEVARDGLARLTELIRDSVDFDLSLRQAYVGGHIQHRVDDLARRGVVRFTELLERHTGRRLHPIRWVDVTS